jgi:hypothetical protein
MQARAVTVAQVGLLLLQLGVLELLEVLEQVMALAVAVAVAVE